MDVAEPKKIIDAAIAYNAEMGKLVGTINEADLAKLQEIVTKEGSAAKTFTKAAIEAFEKRLTTVVTPNADKTDTPTLEPIHKSLTAMNIQHK